MLPISDDPDWPLTLVIDPDPTVSGRIRRIISAATGMSNVITGEDVTIFERLDVAPLVVFASWDQLEYLQPFAAEYGFKFAMFSNELNADHVATLQHGTIDRLIGWPPHRSTPPAWDIAIAARDLVFETPFRSRIPECVRDGASVREWRPTQSQMIDTIGSEIWDFSLRVSQSDRLADAVGEVAYEMLMNAMYDAPVDPDGKHKYNEERTQSLSLEGDEVPTIRFACDGSCVVLEITDRFGGLKRDHVLDSIRRGLGLSGDDVIDSSHGGAGLGMFRMYQHASSLFVQVERNVSTRVIALFDLELRQRDRRGYPTSIHLTFMDGEQ